MRMSRRMAVNGAAKTEMLAGTNYTDTATETYRYINDHTSPWMNASAYDPDDKNNYFGGNSGGYNTACIRVGSFSFDGDSTKLVLSFSGYRSSASDFRWAICNSMSNCSLYEVPSGEVTGDSTQLATGIGSLTNYSSSEYDDFVFEFETDNLPSDDTLYVYLWRGLSSGVAHIDDGTITSKLYYEG